MTVSRIDCLTEAQKAKMPEWAQKWIDYGLSTDEADWDTAERNIIECYKYAGLEPPTQFIRVQSPFTLMLATPIASQIINETGNTTVDMDKVMDIIARKDTKRFKQTIQDYVSSSLGGNLWPAWPAFESFFHEVCELKLKDDLSDRAQAYREISKSIGWWIPTTHFCMMSNRPLAIRIENGVLHHPDKPAIEWRDGRSIAAWRGTVIPTSWLTKRPTAQEVLQTTNVEQRRAGAEMIGWIHILKELDARIIDTDPDPQVGQLVEVMLENDNGSTIPSRFIIVLCGTGREFALGVPIKTKTALEGNLWTYGLEPDRMFVPEVRT